MLKEDVINKINEIVITENYVWIHQTDSEKGRRSTRLRSKKVHTDNHPKKG
jgi:hypothetical protein